LYDVQITERAVMPSYRSKLRSIGLHATASNVFRTGIKPGHHRLIYELSDLMERERWSPTGVLLRAGLNHGNIQHWRGEGVSPSIANFDLVLSVMGYRLAIVKEDAA
jgi:hypothetical protein